MAPNRHHMTARVRSLREEGSGDVTAGATPAECVALVEELTREAWALARRPLPTYTRSTMPIRVVRLRTPIAENR